MCEYFLRRDLLEAHLRSLPTENHRIAFAAAIAEGLFPIYEFFCRRHAWGSPRAFRRALDAVWSHVLGHTLQAARAKELSKECEENTPCDGAGPPGNANAESACLAMMQAVDGCISEALEHAMLAADHAFDIGWSTYEGDLNDQEMARYPGVLKQEERLTELIQCLASVSTVAEEVVDRLRARALATASPELGDL